VHVFGEHAKNINFNSTKSMTGHLLGAAGAIEAISSILAMKTWNCSSNNQSYLMMKTLILNFEFNFQQSTKKRR
jgi:hypothetical protein